MVRRLGAGGMGVVYEALDRERGSRVALKTLSALNATSLYLFKNEFRSLAGVTHPNLVALHELFSDGGQWFFTMEYVEGVPFAQSVVKGSDTTFDTVTLPPTSTDQESERESGSGSGEEGSPIARGAVDYVRLRDLMRQLADGLNALHEHGKLHRDIKPSNVLVTQAGRVAVLDFGLVTETHGPEFEGERLLAGTVAYMSPEQAARQPLTEATDWYSVGVMLYESLTGLLPYRGGKSGILREKLTVIPPEPARLIEEVPKDLNDLCMGLLRRDPSERLTGADVLARLGGGRPRVVPGALPDSFVGRSTELDELGRCYEEMRGGSPVVVCVAGQSGIGKSALVRKFLLQAQSQDQPVILSGRCYEQESVPFKAMDSLVDALSRYLKRLAPQEVAELLPRDARRLTKLFPVLERVEALNSVPSRIGDPLDRQELRRRAFQALRDLLGRIGERHPLVLAIDDMQWGDADSATLLAELLRPPDAPALLLLLSFREEKSNSGLQLLFAELERGGIRPLRLALRPFTEAESLQLVRMLLPGEGAEEEIASTIARESSGNAYFVRELARQARSGSRPEERAGLRLDDLIWERVKDLSDESRRLLEVIAVSGQPLAQRDAYSAAGMTARNPAALAALRADRLVRGGGEGAGDFLETYHDRIRESIVSRLPADVLRAHHGRLGATLEANRSADAETLAIHFFHAGETARAGERFLEAARTASEALAFRRAVGLFERAIELLDPLPEERGQLLEELADAQANAGLGREAAQNYLAAASMPGREQRLDLQRKAGYQFSASGYVDEGIQAFQAVLHRVGLKMPSTALRAFLLRLILMIRLRLRGVSFRERAPNELSPAALDRVDMVRACSIGLSVQEPHRGAYFSVLNALLALEAAEPDCILRALSWEATVTNSLGGGFRRWADTYFAAARKICERRGHPSNRGHLVMGLGCSEFVRGNYTEAARLLQDAETILSETTGASWELGTIRTYQTWVAVCVGDLVGLANMAPAHFKDARERGDCYTAINIGEFAYVLHLLAEDRPTAAAALLRECDGILPSPGYRIQQLMGGIGRTWVEIYNNDPAAAFRLMDYHYAQMRKNFLHLLENLAVWASDVRARAAVGMAEMLLARGEDAGDYLKIAARDASFLERSLMPHAAGFAKVVRAGIAAVRGNREEAARSLEQAVGVFDSRRMRVFEATARRRLGQLRGGKDGRELVERAEQFLRDQRVANIEKLTRLYVCGIGGPE